MSIKHKPVLLNEVIELLSLNSGDSVIDATLGGGGHAEAMLERILPGGKLLAIEWDFRSLQEFKNQTAVEGTLGNLILVNDNYANISKIAQENSFAGINKILFDLGMSSWHIDESGKGFSFLRDEPLDMRYDTIGNEETAAWIINHYSEEELSSVIKEYGEERFARPIARAIVSRRKTKHIITTGDLVEIIRSALPAGYTRGKIHFATKTFQAIRIEVNQEMENVKKGVKGAINLIIPGGRIAVITFHSLEDGVVKNLFRDEVKSGKLKLINKKPIVPTRDEIEDNPRSRSAKLRVVEKIQ